MDTTGAGNTFLGAFSMVYSQTRDAVYAACCGSVAASYSLEQIGIPTISTDEKSPGLKLCNNHAVTDRLKEYKFRVGLQY